MANQILGELTAPRKDTWRKIFVDSAACTLLFAIATAVAGAIMEVAAPFVNTRLAITYLPVWSACMLLVAFYARWRNRLRFGAADFAWAIPVLLVLCFAIDLLGSSSIWVFIVTYVAYYGMWYLRSYFQTQIQKRDEP